MKGNTKFKLLAIWIEEIWEELEIQFYGITVAIIFFVLLYLLFHPTWMSPFIMFCMYIKSFII